MEVLITIAILVFLVAVIGVVLLGPGGDGLRRESSSPKSFGFRSLAGAASTRSGYVLNPRSGSTNHHAGVVYSVSLMGESIDSASRSLVGAASAGSGRVVNQRSYPISHYPGPDHADAAPMVSNGLAGCGESRSDFDPTEFHHTNNFTL